MFTVGFRHLILLQFLKEMAQRNENKDLSGLHPGFNIISKLRSIYLV